MSKAIENLKIKAARLGEIRKTIDLIKERQANELINLGGNLGIRYALLLAPVALVQAISSTTTLFVFFFGIILSVFFPSLGRENLSARNLLQKGAAAALVAMGILLINPGW